MTRAAGVTDTHYLEEHYARFATTAHLAAPGTPAGGTVLDVGAHWLHQALLWRELGFEVIATELPEQIEQAAVTALAATHGIRLVPTPSLETPDGLRALPEGSVDLILFTEIIEHITFNPVAMWRAFHRLLRPGGRVVVTTPNYYALRGRLWRPWRFISGYGGGIAPAQILRQHTYAHHWKEYSLAELERYFRLLSPDFEIARALKLTDYRPGRGSMLRRAVVALERLLPPLRPNLYVEVVMPRKTHGITIQPGWD